MAEKYELIPSGGTDYHGIDATSDIAIGGTDVPIKSVKQLIALAEQRGIKTLSL